MYLAHLDHLQAITRKTITLIRFWTSGIDTEAHTEAKGTVIDFPISAKNSGEIQRIF